MNGRFEAIYSAVIMLSLLGTILVFIINGQVYGVDSWYHVSASLGNSPLLANVFVLGLLGLMAGMFSLVPGKRDGWYFLAAVFFSGLYVVRFIEPELDDFLMYSIGFALITILKANPIRITDRFVISNKVMGYLLMISYMSYHYLIIWPGNPSGPTGELTKIWYIGLTMAIPLYIMSVNSMRGHAIILSAITLAVQTTKLVYTAVPFVIFACLLDLTAKEKIRYSKLILLPLMMVTVTAILFTTTTIETNEDMLERYCDPDTRICGNHEYSTQFYGHYFSAQGYASNGTREFGVCRCVSSDCVRIIQGKPSVIMCGNHYIEVP